MTVEKFLHHLRSQDLFPLWRELLQQENIYHNKISLLLRLLDWEVNPVRVVAGYGHQWVECDFKEGPMVLDWNAFVYKQQLQKQREESLASSLLHRVIAPTKRGEKILAFAKLAYRKELRTERIYATKQRKVPWSVKEVKDLNLGGVQLWPPG